MDITTKIYNRYVTLVNKYSLGEPDTRLDTVMDLYYASKWWPAGSLEVLAPAPEDVFLHDILGIKRHICRDDGPDIGVMQDSFVPKFVTKAISLQD